MRQDLIDTMAAAGLLSNPITLLTTVPVEMILRSRWFASPVFTVPVKDWIACGGGWIGSIVYSENEHDESSVPVPTGSIPIPTTTPRMSRFL